MRCSVGPAQAVTDKIQVVDILTKITAISPVLLAVCGTFYAMVEPFPDKAPLQSPVLLNGLPIFQ